MENTQIKPGQVGLRYGVIMALVSIVYSLIMSLVELQGNKVAGFVPFAVLIAIFILAHNYFKSNGNGFMSYGQGLGIASLITLINAVLSSIFTFIYITSVDDSIIAQQREEALRNMEKQGMSDQEIDQAMQFTDMFLSPLGLTLGSLLSLIFFGILLALLVTAFTHKKDQTLSI